MENNIEQANNKSRTMWVIGSIIVVMLLAGAAFVGGSLLKKQAASASSDVLEVDMSEAEEIPQSEPEAVGIVAEVSGDTITIQEFSMNDTLGTSGEDGVEIVEIEIDDPEDLDNFFSPEFFGADGPSSEVVITRDTKVYQNITANTIVMEVSGDGSPEIPEEGFKLEIKPGDADEIGANSFLTVWGERRGDRIIADVILFQPPPQIPEFDFGAP